MKNGITYPLLAIIAVLILYIEYGTQISDNKIDPAPISDLENCKYYYDGCNNCGKIEIGDEFTCTEIGCEEYREPECLEYF